MKQTLIFCVALVTALYWVGAEFDDDECESMTKDRKSTVIGIDLGTTYSSVGVFKNGRVKIITNDQGGRITPSYVAFTSKGEQLIGDIAKSQQTNNPENTVFNVKRLIGRTWDDKSVQNDIRLYPFKVIKKNNKPHVEVVVAGEKKIFAPEELSAMVLRKMKEIAEAFLGEEIKNAVVTVPAYFNDAQRQATKDAGVIAGLNVMRIINKPTAAAIAFGFDKKEGEKNILVFDLGGGTFDVSLLTINNGVFEVVSTNGNTHLGGEDFDQRVMKHFIKLYMKKTRKDITKDNHAVQKLRREVEKAKRTLSSQHQTRVEIESLFDGKDFSETLTRAEFEELNLDLFHSTIKSLQRVLDDADMKKEEVAEVVLVGGSTRIPKVQQLVKDFFNGKEPYRGINPDEAVVYGAAVQGGVLSRKENMGEFALLDVNPFTLHIEIEGRGNAKVIPHNTVIPTKKILHFTTNINEPALNLLVYEREHSVTNESQLLGRFVLIGMSSSQRVPHIEVIFKIDINGILRITDYKGTSDIKYMVVPHYKNRLSKEDIERMVKDAKIFAYDDKKVRKHVDAKIGLESFIYKLKHQISGKGKLGGKLSASRKRMIEVAIEENISWLESHDDADAEEYKERKKELEEDIQPIISKLYKNAGGTSTPGHKGGDHDEL